MTDQYETGRSDEVLGIVYRRRTEWLFLWEAITEAFAEGYMGWVTVKLPNRKVQQSACQSLYHRRRGLPDSQSLEFSYRKQSDGSMVLFARLSDLNESEDESHD